MTTRKQTIVDVVVPFPHVLVAILFDPDTDCASPCKYRSFYTVQVCSTLDLAKQTLAQHKGAGSVEALGIDSDAIMVLWIKTLGWRRCPVRHLEQMDTEYFP